MARRGIPGWQRRARGGAAVREHLPRCPIGGGKDVHNGRSVDIRDCHGHPAGGEAVHLDAAAESAIRCESGRCRYSREHGIRWDADVAGGGRSSGAPRATRGGFVRCSGNRRPAASTPPAAFADYRLGALEHAINRARSGSSEDDTEPWGCHRPIRKGGDTSCGERVRAGRRRSRVCAEGSRCGGRCRERALKRNGEGTEALVVNRQRELVATNLLVWQVRAGQMCRVECEIQRTRWNDGALGWLGEAEWGYEQSKQ